MIFSQLIRAMANALILKGAEKEGLPFIYIYLKHHLLLLPTLHWTLKDSTLIFPWLIPSIYSLLNPIKVA